MEDVTLVRLRESRSSDVLFLPKVESLGLGYLASFLRQTGYRVNIIDQEVDEIGTEQVVSKLMKNQLLIGFSAIAKPPLHSVLDVIRQLKESGNSSHLTIGGQFATFMNRELLSLENTFDSVVLYEGEQTIAELAKAIEDNRKLDSVLGIAFKDATDIRQTPFRPLIPDLNTLPFPARDTMRSIIKNGGLPTMATSRGCFFKCSFCSISKFYYSAGNPMRHRSADNIVDELHQLKADYPDLNELWFVDDNFFMPGEKGKERVKKICSATKDLGISFDVYLSANFCSPEYLDLLRNGGIRSVFIGAEAADNKTLRGIFQKGTTVEATIQAVKNCQAAGIAVDPGFIMFHPWSTMAEIETNIQFLKDVKQFTAYGIVSFLTPYVFTPIGQEMLSGTRPYKKPRIFLEEEIQDMVPYEIEDTQTHLLLCLTLELFKSFKVLPQLCSMIRKKLRETSRPDESEFLAREYMERITNSNRLAMTYFEKLVELVQSDSEIHSLRIRFNQIQKELDGRVEVEKKQISKILEKNRVLEVIETGKRKATPLAEIKITTPQGVF